MNDDELTQILWDYHLMHHKLEKADAILVLGSHDTRIAEYSARLFLEGWAPLLIFSGGVGKLTEGWERPEAEVFADIAIKMGVPKERILLEPKSTNTGENILFTKELLEKEGLGLRKFILVQKPYMERRTYATFKRHLPEKEAVVTSPPIPFFEYPTEDKPKIMLINIVVGDTQRIKLYSENGFIVPQEIPANVWAAHEELVRRGYNKRMKKNYILFDFDGVIANTFKPAYETRQHLCPHVTLEDYRKQFDGNVNEYVKPEKYHGPDCKLDADFFAEYIPRMKAEAVIFPGMEEVITTLEKEYALIVISSTITSPIQEFLDAHNLSSHFQWIMGNDVHKSKVEKMKMVFEKYKIGPNDCVFVTDTLGDMREATKADVGSIGVTWGFHELERLELGKPFRIVESPLKIPETIAEYFKQISRA